MNRVVMLILGLLAALFSLAAVQASTAAAPAYPAAVSTYDCPHHLVHVHCANSERGPPAEYDRNTDYDADGHLLRGASARLDGATSPAAFAYDRPAMLVQPVRPAGTTEEYVRVSEGDLAPTTGARSAAKAGTGTLRSVDEVLGGLPKGKQSWVRMVPDESSLTTKFNELTEGGTPTTWKDFNGTVIERGDGVQVGMRSSSSSGGGAIDIRMPDGSRIRIHVEQP